MKYMPNLRKHWDIPSFTSEMYLIFSTGTTLAKYITRRKYTYLLLKISAEKFEQLTMHATVFNIQKFKTKCLQEFPELATSYSLKHMQLPIDKLFLREHIRMLFLEKSETELLKSFYFNITEDRIAFDIKKNSKNLVVQSFGGKFIDLERNYFVFRNKILRSRQSVMFHSRQQILSLAAFWVNRSSLAKTILLMPIPLCISYINF